MGTTDLRYARAHPLRYASHFWPHMCLFAAMVVQTFALTGRIFDVVLGYGFWPSTIAVVAALVVSSAVRPLHYPTQVFTAAALGGLSMFRVVAYVQLVVTGAVPPRYFPLIWSLVAHWVILGVLAALWPRVSEQSALRATTAAGRERGTNGPG